MIVLYIFLGLIGLFILLLLIALLNTVLSKSVDTQPYQGEVDEKKANQYAKDFSKMIQISKPEGIRGMIVTAISDNTENDFISRYFAPWVGINEDPVTGSAHTVLGPYWGKILGKRELVAFQASKRGGEMFIKIDQPGRIFISGYSLTIIKGELNIPFKWLK